MMNIKNNKANKYNIMTKQEFFVASLEFYLSLNYEIFVNRTDEDGNGDYIYVAYCKELGEGCIGIGKTLNKAVTHFIEVKNELIKRYYEQGRVIPLPQN